MLTQEFLEDIKDTKQKSRGPFFLKYFGSKLRYLFVAEFRICFSISGLHRL